MVGGASEMDFHKYWRLVSWSICQSRRKMDLVAPTLSGSNSSGSTLWSEEHLSQFTICVCFLSIYDEILAETVGKTCRRNVYYQCRLLRMNKLMFETLTIAFSKSLLCSFPCKVMHVSIMERCEKSMSTLKWKGIRKIRNHMWKFWSGKIPWGLCVEESGMQHSILSVKRTSSLY